LFDSVMIAFSAVGARRRASFCFGPVRLVCILAVLVASLVLPAAALSAPLDREIDLIDNRISEKQADTEKSQSRLEALSDELDELVADYQEADGKLEEINDAVTKAQRELNSATEQQIFYQELFNELSVFAYRNGDVYFLEVVLGTRSFKDLIVRLDYLTKLSQRQAEVLNTAKLLRKTVRDRRRALARQKARQTELVAALQAKQDSIYGLLEQQQAMIDALGDDIQKLRSEKKQKERQRAVQAAQQTRSSGAPQSLSIIFPIPRPYAFSFINDWGFARAGNAAGHQGTDVFAKKGTPLVAVADGVIGPKFGFIRIGGYRLHLIADNGISYYYAHLNNDTPGTDDGLGGAATAYAPGIAPGVRVKQGQLIGYVGDSGDAETTPPHLHFGITVNGNWINPYPYLKSVDWR
jgi:murein DD-endopeptidase MepM/ murein hydrolase activator NlpD